jgi:hypothetical protein
MSDLSSIEKLRIEKLFGMGTGYVIDFSNRTFSEFFLENIGVEIYDNKYNYDSGSKANRLRAFWQKEPNHAVGELLFKLLEYWMARKETGYSEITPAEENLYAECRRIADRLMQDSPVENLEAIEALSENKNFTLLAKSIKDSIRNNEPATGLDRLHTFIVKYIRQLCEKHGIEHDRNKPLHSLFGEYVKYLKQHDRIESQMTERILKTSISILEITRVSLMTTLF